MLNLIAKTLNRIKSRLPDRIVVVGSSTHTEKIARAIRRIPPLDSDISATLDSVRADVSRMTDPSPDSLYPTVATHFARCSSGPQKLAMLAQLVRFSNAQSILEIGTAYGMSAITMAKTQERPNLVTIEISEPQVSISRRHLAANFAGGVEQIAGNKLEVIPRLVQEGRRFDLVFHDGGHLGDAYVRDFEAILPTLGSSSLFVIDDIRWDDAPEVRSRTSRSVRSCYEGWREVVHHRSVAGAIEFNKRLGILLFS